MFRSNPGNAPLVEGGGKAPTVLYPVPVAGLASASTAFRVANATESAAVSSASLTEVLNIKGGGVMGLLAMRASPLVANARIRVTIDGLVVADYTEASLTANSKIVSVIGSMFQSTGYAGASIEAVPFNKSIVVEVSSDGTNLLYVGYKRYLT